MSNIDEVHSYEGLLLTSTSSNKRSLTNQFVDCVKKTKYFVPCTLLSPSKTMNGQTKKDNQILQLKKPIEQQPKRGSLCIAYSISNDEHTNNSILTLHVMRAKQLSIVDSNKMNTFVKVKYSHYFEQCSKNIHGTNSPIYDEKFHIPLNKNNLSTPSKRLTISVCNQSISNNKSDLIGCMSFNMKTLLKTTSCTKTSSKYKWYCLLPESIGRHKCMALNVDTSSALQSKKLATLKKPHSSQNYNQSNGLIFNVDIYDHDEIHFSSGFPCKISEIKSSVNSTSTRPMLGDVLLQVNNINVSRTQVKAVKKLIKSLSLPVTLQLYRRSIPSTSIKIDKIVLNSIEQHEPLNKNLISTESLYLSSDRQCKIKPYDCLISKPILMNIDHQQSLLMSPIDRKISTQSDGSESGVGSESNPYSDGDQDNRLKILSESYEREVLNLIEIEKEFINQIELGVQLYSRPLKHYLISSNEHAKLFQNIEKILAISRYQLNRLQSLSERTIINHIGKIFHEKVQLICEAFNHYISGYSDACLQLKQLIKCASFQRFIHGNNSNLTIEQFLQIPLSHIDNLVNQLDTLCCTCENANDANYLLHVLKELRQCSLHVSSIESSTSQHHCTTTMSLNSANGISSTSSSMNNSDDNDIIELQNRLQFTQNIQPVLLTGHNRHIIFSGVLLLQNENKNYIETWTVLLNDMLLFTQRNAIDTRLKLVSNAILLNDIVDFRSSDERQDALIFLSNKPNLPYKIRYPSKCLQYAWQTILEQRLKTWQRSIHDESSSADSDLE
ncbi:unnamed protein product [Rotaria sordida]|uniref:Uncharacterized protein n=3 Tax=Rotaria sordida TaxID=392033 RepID=A0A815JLX4_9BILA|nr:unnamed protein product [Rotaria sordida]CAF1383853.1 unnamed protein product [Rotaria sordida]CAF1617219.1 unnamed protein product [Rotaria sordida]CAF3760550.1 unnamed protein product [Rotaria sordida]